MNCTYWDHEEWMSVRGHNADAHKFMLVKKEWKNTQIKMIGVKLIEFVIFTFCEEFINQ